jgi:hypothetical protein
MRLYESYFISLYNTMKYVIIGCEFFICRLDPNDSRINELSIDHGFLTHLDWAD